MLYFVENLTVRSWFFGVLPRLLKNRKGSKGEDSCLVIDASAAGMRAANASAAIWGRLNVSRLNFRLLDVRDETGLLIRLRIPYVDLEHVQARAMSEPEFEKFIQEAGEGRLVRYVAKNLIKATLSDRQMIWRALMLVQICAWHARRTGETGRPAVFMESRPWFSTIQWYAAQNGVAAVPVSPSINFREVPFRLVPPAGQWFARALRDTILHLRFLRSRNSPRSLTSDSEPRLTIEYTGYFNVDRPECYSDFFFWQESDLPGNALLMTFSLPQDPLDDQRVSVLAGRGIRPVALISRATSSASVPLFRYWPRINTRFRYTRNYRSGRAAEVRWLRSQVEEYELHRDYWTELFQKEHVRLYVSWYRYDGTHCAIADAIESVGGISAIYQRACQPDAGPEVAVHCDVAFGYAPFDAEVERRSGSSISYHVSVGYFGDHRFKLLRSSSAQVRQQLQRNGARFIIAFFDENSGADERWHTGHGLQRENYAFVLEKLLSDPALGLLLKPKVPSSLRKRLGSVAELLQKAMATGRCHLYEEGVVAGSYPPAVAAMAADVAIHGHLAAATAGLEAALAGVPTLMVDREGWRISPMYELGEGQVVFRNWQDLWAALIQYRRNPAGFPGFGDWSSMLDRLDPFRDGRGAHRMGTYLGWLLEGLKAGRTRKEVMAEAASRYCRLWGNDKITEVNVGPPALQHVEAFRPAL